jgi:5-methylcytosine-specific restriction protein A
LHRHRERNRKLVQQKKAAVRKATGRLACEVCDFDSSEVYGTGLEVIDVHHVVPLHEIGESKTTLSDLALVCPTCHRVIHAHQPFITPAELKAKRPLQGSRALPTAAVPAEGAKAARQGASRALLTVNRGLRDSCASGGGA